MAVGIADCVLLNQDKSLDLTNQWKSWGWSEVKRKTRVKWQHISVYIGVNAHSLD